MSACKQPIACIAHILRSMDRGWPMPPAAPAAKIKLMYTQRRIKLIYTPEQSMVTFGNYCSSRAEESRLIGVTYQGLRPWAALVQQSPAAVYCVPAPVKHVRYADRLLQRTQNQQDLVRSLSRCAMPESQRIKQQQHIIKHACRCSTCSCVSCGSR